VGRSGSRVGKVTDVPVGDPLDAGLSGNGVRRRNALDSNSSGARGPRTAGPSGRLESLLNALSSTAEFCARPATLRDKLKRPKGVHAGAQSETDRCIDRRVGWTNRDKAVGDGCFSYSRRAWFHLTRHHPGLGEEVDVWIGASPPVRSGADL
jgi:hypothetical protein